jgi:hypothetical protein
MAVGGNTKGISRFDEPFQIPQQNCTWRSTSTQTLVTFQGDCRLPHFTLPLSVDMTRAEEAGAKKKKKATERRLAQTADADRAASLKQYIITSPSSLPLHMRLSPSPMQVTGPE